MLRMILRRLLSLLAAVASGGVVMSCSTSVWQPPKDPEIIITDFSYTPTDSIIRHTDVTFRVTLNQAPRPQYDQDLYLLLQMTGDHQPGSSWGKYIQLYDDGHDPDAFAGDLVYTGEWEVDRDRPAGNVIIRADYYYGEAMLADTLTITEDEQQ